MKKLLKILGISLLAIVLLLITIPYIFQEQIKQMIKTHLNNSLNAKVDFKDVNLSLLSSFPKASVSIDSLNITNYKPFEGEQLATAKTISFGLPVKELFKKPSDGPILINTIEINEALIKIKSDKFGNINYNILKSNDAKSTSEINKNNDFTFSIENYNITNSAVSYIDEISNILLSITELNHSGTGTFSTDISELDTQSQANISLSIDNTKYLNNNSIKLDALIDLNLNENKYTFKENKGFINQLPLQFDGFVKLLEEGQEIDLSFKNTGSDFKDFLAVIPSEFSKDLDKVTTTGTFIVDGKIKGMISDTTIPKLDIKIASNNASFKYPDLPNGVENIMIDVKIKNETGTAKDTYVTIDKFNFKIDQDAFQSSATLKNITKNMLVDVNVDGTINLSNFSKAYPIKLEHHLSGILKGKLHTHFDKNAIETNAYERIKNNGNINVSDFVFSSDDVVNPIIISKANIEFNPDTIKLTAFDATSGTSDFKATGTLNNLLGFLLSNKNLKGNFNVTSNTFRVGDFMTKGDSASNERKTKGTLKIPSFLDCTINANAVTVLYDNLTLKNVEGTLIIKDEKAEIKNMSTNIFDGSLTLNGNVDTKQTIPLFTMQLGIDKFNISQSFNDLELFQSLAPIAKVLQGKLNSTIELSGNLKDDYTPNLSTITGNAFVELLTSKLEPKNETLFNQLKGALSFVDFDKLNLENLNTKLTFENGQVNVKPFNLQYKDIKITIGGFHGFDKTMNYQAVFDVPATYLGSEVNNLIAKIDDDALNNITIPVTANIGGSLAQPTVKTDLTSGVANLSKQLIDIQKNKLINKGKDQIKDLLGGVLNDNAKVTSKSDSSITKQSKNPVKDVLDEIIIENKKDSTKTNSVNKAKDVLGGLLGGKKKKQDSVK